MGLLLSDTVLTDPLLDATTQLRDGLGAWAYALDLADDPREYEVADLATALGANLVGALDAHPCGVREVRASWSAVAAA